MNPIKRVGRLSVAVLAFLPGALPALAGSHQQSASAERADPAARAVAHPPGSDRGVDPTSRSGVATDGPTAPGTAPAPSAGSAPEALAVSGTDVGVRAWRGCKPAAASWSIDDNVNNCFHALEGA